jgi:5-methylcytosine-specific restriction endonuclease McrA
LSAVQKALEQSLSRWFRRQGTAQRVASECIAGFDRRGWRVVDVAYLKLQRDISDYWFKCLQDEHKVRDQYFERYKQASDRASEYHRKYIDALERISALVAQLEATSTAPTPIRGHKRVRDSVRRAVWAKSDGVCWYCGCVLKVHGFTVDHVHPQFHGGSDDLANLVPACRKCNSGKGTRTLEEYRRIRKVDQFWFEREGMAA